MKPITAICLTAFIFAAGCEAASPTRDEVEVKNKELTASFFNHFSAGDVDAAFELVSDEASWWVAGDLPFSGTKTKAEYLQIVGNIQTGFPDGLRLDATSMIAEGQKIAVEVSSYGEHVNGKTYTNKYHFLITIQNGEIIEVKEYMDTLHLFLLLQP